MKMDLKGFSLGMKRYHQILENVEVTDKESIMNDHEVSDFVKKVQRYESLRIVLRPSGTEPLIRIMVEGKDKAVVRKVVDEAKEIIERVKDSGKIHKS
jgi:phosphoglucosamine mutase